MLSGLYDTVDKIFCFITGKNEEIKDCIDYLHTLGKKYHIVKNIPNDTTYERFTLLSIKEYIRSGDKFLYLHTKGNTKPHSLTVKYWKLYMDYYLMTKHQQCISDLDNYDIVGIMWHLLPKPHFSGNYWWSNADYFLKLPDTIGSNYTDPEFYISIANPKYKSYSDTPLNLYRSCIIPSMYIDHTNSTLY
jgi:hypothetical protein